MRFFAGIGAQKAGTTWLYQQLMSHPNVRFPGGKELHYWDRQADPNGAEWMRRLQPNSWETADGMPLVSGEITPAYFSMPLDRIALLRRECPDVRLFVSLRNPVTRPWSAALMLAARQGRHERDLPDDWFIEQFATPDSVERTSYGESLLRWWSRFPREQLFITFLDDIASDPRSVLAGLAEHLRIDDWAVRIPASHLDEVVVPRLWPGDEEVTTGTTPLRASLVPVLLERYEPEVRRLSEMLGRDLSFWLDPAACTSPVRTRLRRHVRIGRGSR